MTWLITDGMYLINTAIILCVACIVMIMYKEYK